MKVTPYKVYVFSIIAVTLIIFLSVPVHLFFGLMLTAPRLIAASACAAIGSAIAAVGMSFICYVKRYRRQYDIFGSQRLPFYLDFMIVGVFLATIGAGFLAFAGWRCLSYFI